MTPIFTQLQSLYDLAVAGPPDFYRHLYGPHRPTKLNKLEDWYSLPLLTREDLQKVSLQERLYLPKSEVFSLRTTSGTSGKGVLVSPKHANTDYDEVYKRCGTPTGVLAFYQHISAIHLSHTHHHLNIPLVHGDLQQVSQSVQIALQAGCDTLMCYPFSLPLITPVLTEMGWHTAIKILILTGEVLSASELIKIHQLYPNAHLFNLLSYTEFTQSVGFSIANHFSILDTLSSFYIEIITDGAVCSTAGSEGNIVITTLPTHPLPFPYLRYDTGDVARIVEADKNGQVKKFTLLGRENIDLLKLPGGILKAEELERVLFTIDPALIEHYQLEYHKSLRPGITLYFSLQFAQRFEKKSLEKIINDKLRLGPNVIYSEVVSRDLLEPLKVSFKDISSGQGKRIRFVITT
jgi:phenylacetate-coenzyme A ligase PaaK-like adenylate-forming protein